MIEIENKKMYEWIEQKDALVEDGLKIIAKIEKQDARIKTFEGKEKMITGSVKPDEKLKAEGDALVGVFNETMKRLEEIGNAIEQEKMKAIPAKLLADHKEALKEREQHQRELKKIELKIQKIKDRLIPLIQKTVKPLLNEFDDVDTPSLKNGKVIFTTYNHLDEFKKKYKAKEAK